MRQIFVAMPVTPPEKGGILGGSESIISVWFSDDGIHTCGCNYFPNVNKLNSVIEQWEKKEYSFMGIFHVHFFGVDTLSEGDIRYIKQIMHSMPDKIDRLYFPVIVQPQAKCVPYLACRERKGKILIRQDELEILQ